MQRILSYTRSVYISIIVNTEDTTPMPGFLKSAFPPLPDAVNSFV